MTRRSRSCRTVREHLGDLGGEVLAVRSVPGEYVGTVPPIVVAAGGISGQGKRRHGRIPGRVEEVGERQAGLTGDVADPVRCRSVTAGGESFEHVAEVADEHTRCGSTSIHPPSSPFTWRPP